MGAMTIGSQPLSKSDIFEKFSCNARHPINYICIICSTIEKDLLLVHQMLSGRSTSFFMTHQGDLMQKTVINPKTVFNSLQYGFSQAVVVQGGRRVVLSGQVGVDAEENTVGTDLSTQIEVAINNIEAILAEVDANLSHVVILRIYIVDTAKHDQRSITEALLQRFPVNPPATSWVVVSGLAEPQWLIELEAEAVLPDEN